MAHIQEVVLQWVVVDGEIHHVSDYASVRPQDRPEATCPVCEKPVIMKLGQIRIHHVAHLPDAICAATQPETALHLNTKLYIAKQLEGASELLIDNPCQSTHRCVNKRREIWASDWTHVEVEVKVGSRQPDIALYRGDELRAAIEVRVTHAVDQEKAAYYRNKAIRWIEIEASEDFYAGDRAWIVSQPVPFVAIHPDLETWTCDACATRVAKERQAFEKKWQVKNLLGIIVDFFYPSGKAYRERFWISEVRQGGKPKFYAIGSDTNKRIARHNGPLDQAVEFLKQECRKAVLTNRPRRTIIDSPSGWQSVTGADYFSFVYSFYPPSYVFSTKQRRWTKALQAHGFSVDLPKWLGITEPVFCSRCGERIEGWSYYDQRMNLWVCPDCAEESTQQSPLSGEE